MFYFPSPKTTDPKQWRVQRTLEMIPGILTWVTLIGMLVASFVLPIWIAVFIIMFDIYWIYRTIFITYYSIIAYNKLQNGKKIDWWERCQNIVHPKEYALAIEERIKSFKQSLREVSAFGERRKIKNEIYRLSEYQKEVAQICAQGNEIMDWRC